MSDILDRAYTLSEGHKLCQLPDDGQDALALLPELIAEIKSLRGHLGEELAKNKDLSDAVIRDGYRIQSAEAEIKRLREDRRILMSDNVMTEYISRLEAAYLESEEERITRASYSIDGIIYADRMAREALERIRGEQK